MNWLFLSDYFFLAGFVSESVFYEDKNICIERAGGQLGGITCCSIFPIIALFMRQFPGNGIIQMIGALVLSWFGIQIWDKIKLFYVKRSKTILKKYYFNVPKSRKRIIMIIHYSFIIAFVWACNYISIEILSSP